MRFQPYDPDQVYLLPPSVKEVLGENHLSFFVHRVVERLDLSGFERPEVVTGRPPYAPALMVKVWLYAYALGVTSSRRLEHRVREDLGFRYLAANATPDFWTLNDFRRRHKRALNDLFTQVVELAREVGMGQLGHVAIDATQVAANASRDRIETPDRLRKERAKIRRRIRHWHKQCDAEDGDRRPGHPLAPEDMQALEQRLQEIPQRLKKLAKTKTKYESLTDPDSRFLRTRQGFTLGYSVALAVSEDHLIVEQRVTQDNNDNASLVPVVDAVIQRCRESPRKVSADSGFFSVANVKALTARGIDPYVPDSNLARELNGKKPGRSCGHPRDPAHRHLRQKLRSPEGQAVYRRRKAIVEPVFGVLKEQRGMRRFRQRGLAAVAVEMALATTAFNITRLWRTCPALAGG